MIALGTLYKDNPTQFIGRATKRCEDVCGCVTVFLEPEVDACGNRRAGEWFGECRLTAQEDTP